MVAKEKTCAAGTEPLDLVTGVCAGMVAACFPLHARAKIVPRFLFRNFERGGWVVEADSEDWE